ncbi:YhcG family protein [Leadbetterella sp. DM7]|uniref:PDDEXK nuclease domain-containing protein n=1 Tax=Leadbetterella sp. DM7 TaxID=3235085 RepID=UPI00349E4A66
MKDFKELLNSIENVHTQLQYSAASAVNRALTIRNWLIGFYIVEFEQNGRDRGQYGEKLMEKLAIELAHIKGIDKRALFKFRQFYLVYPDWKGVLKQNLRHLDTIVWSSPQLDENTKVGTLSPLSSNPHLLITRLSYSHFELLINIEEPVKREFYELEAMKGTWSVRELKRQIASMYFERSGLSAAPEKLSQITQAKITRQTSKDIVKNIYTFEFLDIGIKEAVEESDLETALLDNLQQFMLELGNGFCLEARQKRILIGDKYYFIDLVLYHRVLKCHVLVELKVGAFEYENIAQLNTYLNFYKEEVLEQGDNPPIGILLVAEKDQALVKYATAGMDENLFVQKYLIQLPDKMRLKQYIEAELRNLDHV